VQATKSGPAAGPTRGSGPQEARVFPLEESFLLCQNPKTVASCRSSTLNWSAMRKICCASAPRPALNLAGIAVGLRSDWFTTGMETLALPALIGSALARVLRAAGKSLR
jgi:hypothetical protein